MPYKPAQLNRADMLTNIRFYRVTGAVYTKLTIFKGEIRFNECPYSRNFILHLDG